MACHIKMKKAAKVPESIISFCSQKAGKEFAEEAHKQDIQAGLRLFGRYLCSLPWFDLEEFQSVLSKFSDSGQIEWALRICKKLRRKFPALALIETDFLIKTGRFNAALALLGNLRLLPEDDILFRRAAAYFELKDHKNAYECILNINDGYKIPASNGLPFLLAELALDLNRNAPNFELYENPEPKDQEALNLLSLAAYCRKQYTKAERYALQALEKGEREDIRFNLASIYYEDGKNAKARELLERLGIRAGKIHALETLQKIRTYSPVFAGFREVRFAGNSELERAFGEQGTAVERAIKARKSAQWIMKKLFIPPRRLIKILRFCEARRIPSTKSWKERKQFEKEEARKLVSQKYGEIGLKIYSFIDGKKDAGYIMKESGIDETKLLEMLAFMGQQELITIAPPGKKPPEEDLFQPRVDWKRLKGPLAQHLRNGHLDKALDTLQQLKPTKQVYNNIGCVFYRKQDFRNAIAYFDKALKLNSQYDLPKYNKLLSYASLEEYKEAIESANVILKKDALTYHLRGLCYEYLSRFGDAIEDYNKALELNPKLNPARTHIEIANGKKNRRSGEKALNSGAADNMPEFRAVVPSMNFSGVGGMREVKELFTMEIIMPLKKPELAKKYSKGINKSYLLQGPPGCGKSYIAEAVAGEAELNFIRANVSEILNMYVGNSEKNLVAVFEAARRNQPALIFFDEIESLGGKREGMSMHWEKTLVNVFLQEMDKIEKNNERIVVFGATNAPWDLDIALRRSGRMGNEIFIAPPDRQARKEVFEIYTKNLPLESMSLEELAGLTDGHSIANIKSICGKAANAAWKDALDGKERKITKDDFIMAVKSEKSDVKEWMEMAKMRGTFRESLKELKERMYR